MDPIGIVGLASAIITFVDFSWTLVAGAIEIYKSNEGIHKDNAKLEGVISNLASASEELERMNQAKTGAEQRIKQLAKNCQDDAKLLLQILQKVKLPGKRTPWKSLRTQIASMTTKSDIEELKGQLQEYRSEILWNLAIVLQ